MKALVNTPSGIILDHNYPIPEPEVGEARLKIVLAGICSTDLEISEGYKGFHGVLGHEFVGIIDKLSSEHPEHLSKWKPGMRVVSEINCVAEGPVVCEPGYCREHDPKRTAIGIFGHDGAFAEYLCVPISNLYLVPHEIPDELAVFTEPLAAACRIVEQIHVKPSHHIAVLGTGKLGALIAQVLFMYTPHIIAIGRGSQSNFDLLESLGIETALVGLELQKHRHEYDMVVECSGSSSGFQSAVDLVKNQGVIVLKTTIHGLVDQVNLTDIAVREIRIVGSRCGPFPVALELLKHRRVDPSHIPQQAFPLEKGLDALEFARSHRSSKVVLKP